nr:MAG TPA: hypothetical protein [Bacteriophage sp.]
MRKHRLCTPPQNRCKNKSIRQETNNVRKR